jgi:hypothetical protein
MVHFMLLCPAYKDAAQLQETARIGNENLKSVIHETVL